MRSFRQLAKSIIGMIENQVHRVSFDEIFDLIREAAEVNKRESQGQPAFRVDVTDEYIDFRIYNPDAGGGLVCFESSTRARNERDKEGDRWLLQWISNSLSRLLDLQELRWYLVESSQIKHYSPTSRSKLGRIAKDPGSGLVWVKQGVYRVREDKIKDHVKQDHVENLRPFLG
jgi:hypothetical protein